MLRKMPLRVSHGLDVRHNDVVCGLLVEHLAEQTSVAGVIFDQKYVHRPRGHSLVLCCADCRQGSATKCVRVMLRAALRDRASLAGRTFSCIIARLKPTALLTDRSAGVGPLVLVWRAATPPT